MAQFTKNELRLNDASYLGLLQQAASPLGMTLPAYVTSEGEKDSATELLKTIGNPMSAIAFNKILEAR